MHKLFHKAIERQNKVLLLLSFAIQYVSIQGVSQIIKKLKQDLASYSYGNKVSPPIDFKEAYGVENISLKDGKVHVRKGWYLTNKKGNANGTLEIGIYEKLRPDGTYEYVFANAGSSLPWIEPGDWSENGKQLFGESQDLIDSLSHSKDFVEKIKGGVNKNAVITFVGHSKGGAEAAANAVANNQNAILFNPATVNLTAYGLDESTYNKQMTAYIVKGEILNDIFDPISQPIGEKVYLPSQHWTRTPNSIINTANGIRNHLMPAVISAVEEWRD